MKRTLRSNEPLYRFGGEEFIWLMQCKSVGEAESARRPLKKPALTPLLLARFNCLKGKSVEIKSDIEDAIKVHGAWKAQFRDFLSGKAGLDVSEVGHTDACKLGMWLGDGARRMLSPVDHAKACELHAQFHRVAGEIVHNIKQKDFMAARQALTADGAFDQASHELGAFLRKVALRGRPKVAKKAEEAEAAVEPAGTPQQQA